MDPQMQYMMERWRQMMNTEAGVPANPTTSAYRAMVENAFLSNPQLQGPTTNNIMRQMQYESKMDPENVSPTGARGLLGVKPEAAQDVLREGYVNEIGDMHDPENNIKLSTSYMDYLKRRYKGDWEETAQRYNLGAAGYRRGDRAPGYVREMFGTHEVGKFHPEGNLYDEKTSRELAKLYPLTVPKPEKYQGPTVANKGAFQAWVWHPEKKDYVLHSGSRDPRTGRMLKGRQHKTWGLNEQAEARLGNVIFKGKHGYYYSLPKKEYERRKRLGLL